MIKTNHISTGDYAGGIAVVIAGAEAAMLGTMAHEQQIEVSEVLARLICNATLASSGATPGKPRLCKDTRKGGCT